MGRDVWRAAVILGLVLLPGAVMAAAKNKSVVEGTVLDGVQATVQPGGTLRITGNGATAAVTVRLAGIEPAQPPMGAEPGKRWPLAEKAQAAVAAWLVGHTLTIKAADARTDRYGRLVADVYRDDGAWLQQALVAQGWARVRPVMGETAGAAALLAAEDEARRAGRGIWATRAFAVRAADDVRAIAAEAGGLTLVEGVVRRADARDSKVYLDFGDDWRRDFSVLMSKTLLRGLVRNGDAGVLAGRRLRVRGWPEWHNGPQIGVDVIEQVEVLD